MVGELDVSVFRVCSLLIDLANLASSHGSSSSRLSPLRRSVQCEVRSPMSSQMQSRMMPRSARSDCPTHTRVLIVQRAHHELGDLGHQSISRCSACQPCTWPSQPQAHEEDFNCGSPDALPWSWRSRPKGYDADRDYMAIPATSACCSLCWCR